MGQINLTSGRKIQARCFMTNVFYYGSRPMYHTHDIRTDVYIKAFENQADQLKPEFSKLADELIQRTGNFVKNDLDACLTKLAAAFTKFPVKQDGEWRWENTADFGGGIEALTLAYFIAWYCQENGLTWDTRAWSIYEKKEIDSTILGHALKRADCFIGVDTAQPDTATADTAAASAPAPAPAAPAPASAAPASAAPASANVATKAPANSYKSLGPQGAKVNNIINYGNGKIDLTPQELFCVIADKRGKNTPGAFITPIKTSGNSVTVVSKADAETIRFGSGNGYTDCLLWFDTLQAAEACRDFCRTKFEQTYSNYQVAKHAADKNGYFKVSTEIGDAFIKANKLNESACLKEAIGVGDETADTIPVRYAHDPNGYVNASKNSKITDPELYSDWMFKSIN